MPIEEGDPLLSRQGELSTSELKGPGPDAGSAVQLYAKEALRVLRLAGPLAAQDLLILLQSTVVTAAVGHVDAPSLSAMVLCITAYNVSGLSLVMGVASGAETFSGQCFGAKNYAAVGIILQRSLLIVWLMICLILVAWTKVHAVLVATGQEPILAARATVTMWQCAPALIATGTTECLKRYLMAQGIVVPTCMIYVVNTALTPLIAWACIFGLSLGLPGAALALDIVATLNLAAMLAYVLRRHVKLAGTGAETWRGWSRSAWTRWGEYFKLAAPSTVMMCLEWWTWEALIIMTGKLDNAERNLGLMGVMFQIAGICYMPPMGLQGAASTRVSNELGDGRPAAAFRAFRTAAALGLASQTCIAAGVFAGRAAWGSVFSADSDVVAGVAATLPILTAMMPCDGVNAVCTGAVRGCGRQLLAACMNVFTFWGVGLPLAAYLAFATPLGVRGLWLGLATVTYVQTCAIMALVCCLDWGREAQRAAKLVGSNRPEGGAASVLKV